MSSTNFPLDDSHTSAIDNLRELVLDRVKVGMQTFVSHQVVDDVRVEILADFLGNQLRAGITTYVLADHLAPATHTATFQRPASTWQHVKASLFPGLWRRLRRPARFVTESIMIDVASWATFPQAEIAYPAELGPVRMLQQLNQLPYFGWGR